MSEQFDIEARWPALFEGLDSRTKRAVVRSLAAGWHEGWKINYADVHDLVEFVQGSIDLGEYEQRARRAAEQAAMKSQLSHRKRAQLVHPETSTDELREIAEGLGWLNPTERAWAAEQLIAHPNFTHEAFDKAITNVNAIGFFEDPTEHNATVAALETARSEVNYAEIPGRADSDELRTISGTKRHGVAATASAAAAPAAPKRTKMGYYAAPEDSERIRAAFIAARNAGRPYRSLSDFQLEAILEKVVQLETELNGGRPFEGAPAHSLSPGRPME